MIPPSWPPPRAEGRTFSWRFTRLTPSTSTRLRAGRTAITRPSLPASLPDRTWTRSPLRMRAATYNTSGASEMIFMKRFSLSSRATGPKTRVPRGLFWSLMMTTALSSKRM